MVSCEKVSLKFINKDGWYPVNDKIRRLVRGDFIRIVRQ